jgi:hypothetical protein
MKTGSILFVLILLASACAPQIQSAPFKLVSTEEAGSSTNTPSPDSLPAQENGVKGQALIGPTCPVMTVESPCPDQPYQANLVIWTLDGQEVTRFKTDAEGKFQVNLPPGDYILHPEVPAGKMIPSAADVPFTVNPGEFTELIVSFDSGIR